MAPRTTGRTAGSARAAVFAFLCDPTQHFDGSTHIELLETHLSWVFLSRNYVWKMKKPARTATVDFTTLLARRRNCEAEVRLNGALAPGVYHGTVAITADTEGHLHWGGSGRVHEWLVWMQRLPRERMLDALVRQHAVPLAGLRALASVLARFHAAASRPATDGYLERLAAGIAQNAALLRLFADDHETGRAAAIAAFLRDFVFREHALFAARIDAGRIVEGHGDLRPAHLCLTDPPLVIDCLEFSEDLRTVDTCEDLACLEVECERLQAAWVGRFVLAAHALESGDRPPRRLQSFHAASRALLRARLAFAHLLDCPVDTHARWSAEGRHYLDIAQRHAAALRFA